MNSDWNKPILAQPLMPIPPWRRNAALWLLAADILRKHYSLEDKSKPMDQVSFMRVNQLDGIRRAKELWAMGYEDESRASGTTPPKIEPR